MMLSQEQKSSHSKKNGRRLVIAALLASIPALTSASIYCQGSVVSVYVSSSGDVIFQPSYRVDYTEVCNLQSAWQSVNAETCFAWYSQLIAAKTHSKNVLLQYAGNGYTCSTIATYENSPAPAYIMVTD